MKPRHLLVLPVLSPLLAVLLVAALNPGPRVTFRLLTWQTPEAPLGLWLASAALGGAALSGGAAGLARRQEAGRALRRTVSGPARERDPWLRESPPPEPWRTEDWDTSRAPERRSWRAPAASGPSSDASAREWTAAPRESVAPARAPGEPAPTLVVPFRVLRRPGATGPQEAAFHRESWPARQGEPTGAPTAREPMPVATTDDWGDAAPAEEDW
ncbi:MAG: DUF1049 domain-containing protein [Cyanobacteria bacterium K_Offshore_surface_m2_239]|nr:DUF1049 domain-containing protein [Cyanobacteria bacterium K_Offshore_surface_m2_239]